MQKMQICLYHDNRWRYRKRGKFFRVPKGGGALRGLSNGIKKYGGGVLYESNIELSGFIIYGFFTSVV